MDKNLIVLKAIAAQIEKPARAIVNSESAFVSDRIRDEGYPEVAREYWNWVCSGCETAKFGEDVMAAQDVLKQIGSRTSSMPNWGTYGT